MTKHNLPWDQRYEVNPKTGCFNWLQGLTHGYAQYHQKQENGHRKTVRAHRVAWEMANDPIPEGAVIRHSCDNPKCINPDHLILGTQKDNVADMVKRNRCTPRRRRTQLTDNQVRDIRFRLDVLGDPVVMICKDFGLSRFHVRRIRTRVSWRHVE